MAFLTANFRVTLPHQRTKRNACRRHAPPHVVEIRCVPRAAMGDDIEKELQVKFAGEDISRVLASFRAVREGRILEEGAGTDLHQHAHSFVEGLTAQPWHDPTDFPWCNHLASNWEQIAEELRSVTSLPDLETKATNAWRPAVVEAAKAYGPDWRTFPLQDRKWDAVNSKLFPKTVQILKDSSVPSVEIFFARQAPESGISLHTDFCNFQITAHIGLDVPTNECWIEVGGERKYYEEGQMLIFDTSFMHQTWNSSTKARDVLLMRLWHPELTTVERNALQWIFDVIEDPELLLPSAPAQTQQLSELGQGDRRSRRKSAKRNKQKNASSGKGFGK